MTLEGKNVKPSAVFSEVVEFRGGWVGGVDGFKNTQWYLLRLVAGGTGNKGNGVFVQRERSELTMGPGWRGGGGGAL